MRSIISILALSSVVLVAQSTQFVGTWRPPHWRKDGRNLGTIFHIVQAERGLQGTVHFWDPRSDHESIMLNPKLDGSTFTFEVDDEYLKGKITFSMTVQKNGKVAIVKGSGGELLLDFKLVKTP